jgi:hypothetical protein
MTLEQKRKNSERFSFGANLPPVERVLVGGHGMNLLAPLKCLACGCNLVLFYPS